MSRSPRNAAVTALAVVAAGMAAMAAGCGTRTQVRWEAEQRMSGAVAPGALLVFGDGGAPAVRAPVVPIRWPGDSTACPAARAAVPGGGDTVVAAWWQPRPPKGSVLLVSRSPNGGVDWERAVEVGTSGTRAAPCDRPPPGVAATAGDATVVAFHGVLGDTAGIVIAAVRPGARRADGVRLVAPGGAARLAGVAVTGDTIAVAYESPAVADGAVWLAIWVGPGQIPVVRERVSGADARARAPLVALHAGRLAVGWNEAARGSEGPAAVVRVGRLRR
ncbi:MAG: hypothetical protein U9Q74_07995 [Gemmatimonadota bacterium]|nr:hypothetical protein [Gemmatimonadota bacterium]